MWFKALQIYTLDKHSDFDLDLLEKNLLSKEFEPCAKVVPRTWGWAPPTGKKDGMLYHASNGFIMICLKFEEKLIPQQVIKQHLDEKIEKMEADGHQVLKKERLRLKDEVIHSLMLRAFHKSRTTYAYIDIKKKLLVVDAGAPSKADEFLGCFGQTFEFKVSRPEATSTVAKMTQWLAEDNTPVGFAIEDACVLQDSKEDSSSVKFVGQDALSDQAKDYLLDHYYAKQILMSWDDKLMFMVHEGIRVSRLHFLDDVKAEAKDAYGETDLDRFDADFVIMTETLRDFIVELLDIFVDKKTSKSKAKQLEAEPA